MNESIIPFWNKKDLKPPLIRSFKILSKNPEKTSLTLAEIFEAIMSQLSTEDLLHHDAALISRLLFKTKRTLRNHKGYKCFQKVRQCLSRYLSLDLLSVVTEIRLTAYGAFGPSKEVLEWGLISLKRFVALFHRLQGTCFEAAYHMHNHIKTGDNWHLAIMFLACISRVWTISHYLISQACDWYVRLKSYLSHLQRMEEWLPADYELPADLKSWLGNPDYLNSSKRHASINEGIDHSPSKNPTIGLTFNEDLGEIISRPSNARGDRLQEKSEVVLQKCEDITAFVKNEQAYRKSNNPKCQTKKLTDTEWQYLRNYLKKAYIELKSAKDRDIFIVSLEKAQQKLNKWINNR